MSDAPAVVVAFIIVVVRAVFWWKVRREQGALFAIARDRHCPKCGRSAERNQMVAVGFEHGGLDSSRTINRCMCGELTMFDKTGDVRHVDPPSANLKTSSGADRSFRPAIGVKVRILCGGLGCAFALLAGMVAFEGEGSLALLPLAFALMFLGVAIFASGPPPDASLEWGRVRHDRVLRLQVAAASIGFLCFVVTLLLSYAGALDPSMSILRLVGASLIGAAMLLEFPLAYYSHYAELSGD